MSSQGPGMVILQMDKAYIADLTRIMEGYEHIALVTTLDPQKSIVKLIATPDTYADLNLIIDNLPFPTMRITNFGQ